MSDGKALAREIAKRKPARFVEVQSARMKRTRIEGERGRPGQDLMEYEAALRLSSETARAVWTLRNLHRRVGDLIVGKRVAPWISNYRKQSGHQAIVSALIFVGAAAFTIFLGWLAIEFIVRLVAAFEVIGGIVSWILWPFQQL